MARPKPTTTPTVAVIGLDGATPEVVDALLAAGELPNLAALIARGICTPLRSATPVNRWAAWPSLMTGKYPGKHGVFDRVRREGYCERVIGHDDIGVETLWETLGKHGLRICMMGVPVTYPPPRIAGALIAGGPMPVGTHTYPARLADGLYLAAPGYPPLSSSADCGRILALRGPGALARHVEYCFDVGLRAALYLLRRDSWDAFVCVFGELDRVQQIAPWPPSGAGADSAWRRALLARCYRKADRVVGALVGAMGDAAAVALVSPYGMGENRRVFYLNHWLADQGWLAINGRARRRLHVARSTVDQTCGALGYQLSGILGTLPLWLPRIEPTPPLALVDWGRTRASAASGDDDGIRLNVRGREPQGLVEPGAEYENMRDALMAMLSQVRDPDDGEAIVAWARRREEVYRGSYVDRAPDIVYATRDHACSQSDRLDTSCALGANASRPGGPRPQGMLVLAGAAIAPHAEGAECRIVDLAPTLLHVLGLPAADDSDGKILSDVFDEDYRRRAGAEPQAPRPLDEGDGYSPQEQRAVAERLRALGQM